MMPPLQSPAIARVAYLLDYDDTQAFRMFRAIGSCESRAYENEEWDPEQFWLEVYGK